MKIPYINLLGCELSEEEVKILPLELALFHDIIVVDKIGNNITIAIPYEEYYDTLEITKLRNSLSKKLNHNVQFVSVEAERIEELIHYFYSKEKSQVC